MGGSIFGSLFHAWGRSPAPWVGPLAYRSAPEDFTISLPWPYPLWYYEAGTVKPGPQADTIGISLTELSLSREGKPKAGRTLNPGLPTDLLPPSNWLELTMYKERLIIQLLVTC